MSKRFKLVIVISACLYLWIFTRVKIVETPYKSKIDPYASLSLKCPYTDLESFCWYGYQKSLGAKAIVDFLKCYYQYGLSFFEGKPIAGSTSIPNNQILLNQLKERFNYASFDCAASVLQTNPEAKGAAAVLNNNKDSYMRNYCKSKKFLVVELCAEIKIDTIVMANLEFFSSSFKVFRVFYNDRYPSSIKYPWKFLAEFQAANVRTHQTFIVPEMNHFAKYIKIEFVTHYGSEVYCPLSVIRVYGTTMMEDYRKFEEEEPDPFSIEVTTTVPVTATTKTVAEQATSEFERIEFSFSKYYEEYMSMIKRLNVEERKDESLKKEEELDDEELDDEELYEDEFSCKNENVIKHLQCDVSETPTITTMTKPDLPTNIPGSSVNYTFSNQENVFKRIIKRLATLEANLTLTKTFIVEQSQRIKEILKIHESEYEERLTVGLEELESILTAKFGTVNERLNRRIRNLTRELERQDALFQAVLDRYNQVNSQQVIVMSILAVVSLFVLIREIITLFRMEPNRIRKYTNEIRMQQVNASEPILSPQLSPLQNKSQSSFNYGEVKDDRIQSIQFKDGGSFKKLQIMLNEAKFNEYVAKIQEESKNTNDVKMKVLNDVFTRKSGTENRKKKKTGTNFAQSPNRFSVLDVDYGTGVTRRKSES
jgi:hypothetical protein